MEQIRKIETDKLYRVKSKKKTNLMQYKLTKAKRK